MILNFIKKKPNVLVHSAVIWPEYCQCGVKKKTINQSIFHVFQCQKTEVGKELPNGLILGHGYNVTKVVDIKVEKKLQGAVGSNTLMMVRLANPWGVKEWNGAWSDE